MGYGPGRVGSIGHIQGENCQGQVRAESRLGMRGIKVRNETVNVKEETIQCQG